MIIEISKKIFNQIEELIVIYNPLTEDIWINLFCEKLLETNSKRFVNIFNNYCYTHSIRELFYEGKTNNKIGNVGLKINDKIQNYEVNAINVDERNTVFIFKNISLLFEKDEIIKQARYYDELTNLKNRKYLLDIFKDDDISKVVLFFDVEKFKDVNDIYGHYIGDYVLKTIATRIKNELKSDDVIIRYGGDEFVVVLNDVADDESIKAISRRIANAIYQKMTFDKITLNIKVNIGYSLFPADSRDIKTLVKYADMAMYKAKRNRNIINKFDYLLLKRMKTENKIKKAIEIAIKNKDIYVKYQGIDNLYNSSRIAFEAFVRIDDEKIGVLLDVAKKTSLVIDIDKVVAAQVAKVSKRVGETIFMNISLKSLFSDDYFTHINYLIDKYMIKPGGLGFDISEKILVNNYNTVARISKFKSLGVVIAVDDYGTGGLSLNDINYLGIDIVKIDNSLIKGINKNIINQKIASSIIGSSKIFKKQVIAKGIEDIETYKYLKAVGCSHGQGYFIEEPKVIKNENTTKVGLMYNQIKSN